MPNTTHSTLNPSQIQKAVQYNTRVRAVKIGWYHKFSEIMASIGGNRETIVSAANFADAIAFYQSTAPTILKVDGMLGPRTWRSMQKHGYFKMDRCYRTPAWLR